MRYAKEPPCLTARAADDAWFQYRRLVLTCRRARGPHAPPAIDARAECLPAPPTGNERRRQTSVNNKPTYGIGSPCHPLSVAVQRLHAAPTLPMRKIVKFKRIGISSLEGGGSRCVQNATNLVESIQARFTTRSRTWAQHLPMLLLTRHVNAHSHVRPGHGRLSATPICQMQCRRSSRGSLVSEVWTAGYVGRRARLHDLA